MQNRSGHYAGHNSAALVSLVQMRRFSAAAKRVFSSLDASFTSRRLVTIQED